MIAGLLGHQDNPNIAAKGYLVQGPSNKLRSLLMQGMCPWPGVNIHIYITSFAQIIFQPSKRVLTIFEYPTEKNHYTFYMEPSSFLY